MADSKITALTALTAADPVNDMFPVVDVSDTTMAASGTTKKISVNNILSSSPTASGALTVTGLVTAGSATISGAATVGTTLGVTGVSTFAAGTALLPALTTTGDTNTGIYYPAADTFAVTTGGTERYRVDSSGYVGVGVTPNDRLTVLADNYLSFQTANTTQNSGRVARIGTVSVGTGNGYLIFETYKGGSGGGERLRIDSDGNVIITSPATPATLATNGQLTVNATSNTNLRFSYRGSDGTTRVANITLA